MKITKFLLFCLAIALFSCGEDEEPIPTSTAMVGTWEVTEIDYSGTTTTSALGVEIKAVFTGKGKDMDLTTTFTADPNLVASEGSYTIELKTTVAGSTTTQDVPFTEILEDGTWSLDGRTLTITTDAAGTQEATITKQTGSELKVRAEVDDTEDAGGGVTIRTQVKAVYTFRKI